MDPAAPPAAPDAAPPAAPEAAPDAAPPGQALAQAPALAQINGQEGAGNEREAYLWRPWLSSINDQPRQERSLVDWAAGGATAADAATKADPEFHHPVRLYWPKSRSFDYLYSAGEILLHNFPVQATINLYEDSNSDGDEEDKEEEEEEEEDEEEEDVNESEPEGCMGVQEAAPHKATAPSPDPHSTCPN